MPLDPSPNIIPDTPGDTTIVASFISERVVDLSLPKAKVFWKHDCNHLVKQKHYSNNNELATPFIIFLRDSGVSDWPDIGVFQEITNIIWLSHKSSAHLVQQELSLKRFFPAATIGKVPFHHDHRDVSRLFNPFAAAATRKNWDLLIRVLREDLVGEAAHLLWSFVKYSTNPRAYSRLLSNAGKSFVKMNVGNGSYRQWLDEYDKFLKDADAARSFQSEAAMQLARLQSWEALRDAIRLHLEQIDVPAP